MLLTVSHLGLGGASFLLLSGALGFATAAPLGGAGATWGVQLSGSFSEDQALATYERVRRMLPEVVPMGAPVIVTTPYGNRGPSRFYRARVGAGSRAEADALCGMIREAGGSCAVLRMNQRP
jgi:hypothetical protein